MKNFIISLLFFFASINLAIATPALANLNSAGYTTAGGNPFVNITPRQCTWYAWGRAFEKTGIKVQFSQNSGRNGEAWYRLVTGLNKGSTPQSNSLVSFGPTKSYPEGHVAFIEEVNNGSVVLSEANVSSRTDYTMQTLTMSQLNSKSGGVVGYIYLGSVTVKDLWVKSNAPIIANTANGFDAQFKLVNSSSSAISYAKVALSIHDASKNYLKDMKIFDNVTIPAGGTWSTGIVYTNVPANAGTYYAVAKVAKNGTDWVNLADQAFIVTVANNLTRLGVTCPVSRLNPAQTTSCAATAYYSNGSNKSVTGTATTSWVTNNSNVATVSSQGVVTAKGAASDSNVNVTATYKDGAATQQGYASLTVTGLDGKLPADYGCTADQKNVASKAITGGSIVLMYSSKCGTNWAMAIPTNSTLATTATVTRTTGGSYSYTGKGTIYTPMVYSPTTKSCASGKIGNVSVPVNTVCR
jgi:hypothetical protein